MAGDRVRPAPLPADTRAKGWRLEIDHERYRQSDTWALASPEQRPWLLMLAMVAWEQTPCGSMPGDDELIAARLGMTSKAFAKNKAVLLRGWWLADDGRMYHNVLVQRALEMLAERDKTAQRVAKHKLAQREQRSGNALPTREQPVENGTGTGTGTKEIQEPPPPSVAPPLAKSPAVKVPCPEGVNAQVWADWLSLRKAKRAPVTATTVQGAETEAGKAGLTLDAFLRVWCARGSQGLQADWLKPHERGSPPPQHHRPLSPGEARMLEACPSLVSDSVKQRAAATQPKFEVIDATPATAIRLG